MRSQFPSTSATVSPVSRSGEPRRSERCGRHGDEGAPAEPPAKVLHLTPAERAARGRAARAEAPRTSHAALDLAPGRDPLALVDADRASRVQDLVPIRYGRMLVSPFTFYRGAAAIMAHDLAATPRSGLNVQLCGDAHLSNFGGFASPERDLVFDLNDFDETHAGRSSGTSNAWPRALKSRAATGYTDLIR